MKFERLINRGERFLTQASRKTPKSQETTELFRYFIAESVVGIALCGSLLIISLIVRAPIMVEYAASLLIVLGPLSLSGYFLFKKVEYCMLLQKLVTISTVVFFTVKMGGLLTSGGIIILGAAPVFKTLVFKQRARMVLVYILFLCCIIFLAVFDSHFSGKNLLSVSQNKFFFALNFTVIISYIFFFARYIQRMFTKLEHNETLRQKEINRAKSRLYTNITHEFRTPLSVILAIADSLKKRADTDTKTKADTLIRNGRNLLQLIDNLLDLNKLETGNLRINQCHGNIIPFLKETFQLQEYAARQKNIRFIFKAEPACCSMDFDALKIKTIVTNLLSNAIKFTPADGYVLMRVRCTEKQLTIAVHDSGIGIPTDRQQKIFERFYQIDDSDSRPAEGSGIGLALTKELVELLKGTINLVSKPGKTVFKVNIPITSHSNKELLVPKAVITSHQEQTPARSFTNEIESPENESYKLLIAEDNADLIDYLTNCFDTRYEIQTATTGSEARLKALQTIPDLIISDVMMPEMDGFTLCKKLKEDYRTSHIPIILLTAKADMPSRIEGLEQGADAYIAKPFSQEELEVRMKKLLELRLKLYERYANGNLSQLSPTTAFIREDQFMTQVTDIINRQLVEENFNVHVLCAEMAMSKSQLYRKFSALTNMSAAKYIRKLRMQRARHLLLTSSLNITEISYEVGIKTPSTFSEIFKDEFGQSPSDYQNHFNGHLRKN
ncbi:hybrid sensor histidine kinase/response regulator transcription factor [Mangrovibacterium lignilyticum]|uniref:hybrid sensor histidine kinase/response regulator transcription factor n=1 Tax=Mangrovibacterium lignilyticum TaxID=2668052 RepID=UPI0013D22AA8|nr:ATP-binding protein [Mangrovibacterium lignilyticum]